MTNVQLLEAVLSRAQIESEHRKRDEGARYESLEEAFCDAIRKVLLETSGAPVRDSDFQEHVVARFILVAADDGFDGESISKFLGSLAPDGSG